MTIFISPLIAIFDFDQSIKDFVISQLSSLDDTKKHHVLNAKNRRSAREIAHFINACIENAIAYAIEEQVNVYDFTGNLTEF